jgi:hypothetical protein
MKRFLAPLAFLTIAAALLPVAVPPAYACSCGYRTPEEKTQQADLVVVGIVRDVRFPGAIDEIGSQLAPGQAGGAPGVTGEVITQIEGYLKGTGADVLAVEQHVLGVLKDVQGNVSVELPGETMCGLFGGRPLDERYLLFLLNYGPGTYSTNICSGSMRLHPVSDAPPYAGYTEGYTALLAGYDDAFGLPPGTLVNIANSPGPFSLPRAGGPRAAARQSGTGLPWLAMASGAGGAALLAASAYLLRRRIMGRDDSNPGL